MLPTEWRDLSVCDGSEPAKTAEPIEIPFGLWVVGSDGSNESCIIWGPDPSMERGNFEGREKGDSF